MKKYAKTLQTDARGQIVIPKEIREALGLHEGSAFFAYLIQNDGIFLKRIPETELSASPELQELKANAQKVGVNKKNITDAESNYKKQPKGDLHDI